MGFFDLGLSDLFKAGGDILGGFMDREQAQDVNNAQNWWGKHGIKAKIKDAESAGISPIYALGASTFSPTYSTSNFGEAISRAGQNLGNAAARALDSAGRERALLENKLLKSQALKTDAEQMYYDSMTARNMQEANIQKNPGQGVLEGQQYDNRNLGIIDIDPSKVISSKKGAPEQMAGVKPYFEERALSPTINMLMPDTGGDNPEEILSEMSMPAYVGLLLRNANHYGKGWLENFLRWRYLGQKEVYGPPAPFYQ